MFLAADKTGRQLGPPKTSAFLAHCVTIGSGSRKPPGLPGPPASYRAHVPHPLFPGTHFLLGVVYLPAHSLGLITRRRGLKQFAGNASCRRCECLWTRLQMHHG